MRSSIRPQLNHATVVAYLALFVALGGGAFAMSARPAAKKQASTRLVACVAKRGGAVRLVSSSRSCRRRSERSVTWNRAGLTGPAGPAGPAGAAGAIGAAGTPDPAGFYSRTESDARYLAASRFGGADKSEPVNSGGGGFPSCTVGEVMLFAGKYPPKGTLFADGQLVSIASNTALFQILGTHYGGDGTSTFAVPDMRGIEPAGVNYVVCTLGIYP